MNTSKKPHGGLSLTAPTNHQSLRGSHSVKNLHSSVNQSPMMSRTSSQPFFNHSIMKKEGPSFLVKAMEIPSVSRTIDFERLLMRPKHKPNRLKFDKNNSDCLNEKENDPLTM